jgi:hypothetical protein
MSEKDVKKLYPVSDKDIKAMRDQLENGTNSYSKINQSIINRFKQEQEKEDRNREIEKMKERSKEKIYYKEGEEEGEAIKELLICTLIMKKLKKEKNNMNPFTKTGKTPRLGVKSFSVEDVKASNKRFYEKFPSAKEDAAMLKKAMLNPEDEIVKVVDQEKADREMMMKKFKIEIEIDD